MDCYNPPTTWELERMGDVACDNCNFPCDYYGYCWREKE